MNKRGQVTIFIIIAILVVAIVAVVFMVPKIREGIGIGKVESPENFIQTCLEDVIKEDVETLSLQGGSLDPEDKEVFTLYDDEKVSYLCYTEKYFEVCMPQQPLLEKHIENEIQESIEEDVNYCFDSLKESYEKKGYEASVKKGDLRVDLLPKRIITTINNTFVFSKGEQTERHESFSVIVDNNLYELIGVVNSIVEWESYYGGAPLSLYMDNYKYLKIEKKLKSDGTKIYILTDRNTETIFQFASRSVVYPSGGI